MTQYIVKDTDGNVVGKYEQQRTPAVPDHLTVREVGDVNDYEVAEWWDQKVR